MSTTITATAQTMFTEARMSLKGLWQAVYARLLKTLLGVSLAVVGFIARFPKLLGFFLFLGAFLSLWMAEIRSLWDADEALAHSMIFGGVMGIVELVCALFLGWGWYSFVSALLVAGVYGGLMFLIVWLFAVMTALVSRGRAMWQTAKILFSLV